MTDDTSFDLMESFIDKAISGDPVSVARRIDSGSVDETVRLIESHPDLFWEGVLRAVSSERGAEILEKLSAAGVRRVLEAVDPSVGALLLSRAEADVRERLLSQLAVDRATELRSILAFPADTAGALMDSRAMAFLPEATAGEVLTRLRTTRWKRVFEIFVVDGEGMLLGAASLQEVAICPPETPLSSLKHPLSSVVHGMTTREEVVQILETQKLPVLPVTDLEGRFLGVIRYDALITATAAEASLDIQTMVGASKEERALSKTMFAVKKRLPWLEINLGTAFLAASVVGIFESLIAQFTALAILLPVVAGQSGNTGAQALAVTMRGLALREIRVSHWARVLFKEFRVGLVNGIAVAVTTSIFVFLWSRSLGLAAVIGSSMVLSMSLAGLSGGAIPMLLTALRQDPAQSSSIILTTVTDVVGFFSFLGIATMLARFL